MKINTLKYLFFVLLILVSLTFFGCSKGSDPAPTPPPPVPEANIVFTINPDPGTTIYPALGATQDIIISISSKLPDAGVTASISVTKDLDGSSVFSQSLTSTLSSFTSTIQNLQSGVVCNATITLVSKSTATNTASKTFKLAKK
jgi:hypothetical protein